MKLTYLGGVLLLLFLLSLLNFSVYTRKVQAQTGLDVAIISTTPLQSVYYYNYGFSVDIQIIVDVTYKNIGTVDYNLTEGQEVSYGYQLVHESSLSYYLNTGGFTPPLLTPWGMGGYGYSSLASSWVGPMYFPPGQNFTQTQSNLYVYIGPPAWDYPLSGNYYLYPYVLLGDDDTGNNVPWWSSVPFAIIQFIGLGSVGGTTAPINKLELVAPYIGLTSTIIVATVAAAIFVKRVKHRKEKQ